MMENNMPNWWKSIPPVTRTIIIVCVLVWIVEMIVPKIGYTFQNHLALHYWGASKFSPGQLFTYMFLHDTSNPIHLLFNMFTLWMFGRLMENVWGSRRFLIYFLVCGIGAAVVQEIVWGLSWQGEFTGLLAQANQVSAAEMQQFIDKAAATGDMELAGSIETFKNSLVCIGASGAIFGILLGFAFVFPNMPLYLFFIPIPIKAKYMVLGYAVLEFFLGVSGGGTVAHFAHLGGMLFGIVLLLWWKRNGTLRGGRFY